MRKVIFVSSGNSGQISPIVLSQGESLQNKGVQVSYFLIKGKGIFGYLKNIQKLTSFLKANPHDAVHAHYSWSAIVATIAGSKKIVVSLMGSDVQSSRFQKWVIHFFCHFFWKTIIVKSADMKQKLGYSKVLIIPNGVNFCKFFPKDKKKCQEKLQWDSQKFHLLFAGNPNRYVKNFRLANNAVKALNNSNIVLHTLEHIPFTEMNDYYNASDAVILSSLWEGSPNVIKEAMACNKPILSTDVGDVKFNFGDETGFFLATHDVIAYTNQLNSLIEYARLYGTTNGRQRLIALGLDHDTVAEQLIVCYDNL